MQCQREKGTCDSERELVHNVEGRRGHVIARESWYAMLKGEGDM